MSANQKIQILVFVLLPALLLGMAAGLGLARWLLARGVKASALRLEALKRKPAARAEWLNNLSPRPRSAGWTIVAAMNGAGCLGRSAADEPVFVLCARDKAASMAVREWAALAEKLGAKAGKLADARTLADEMEQWRLSHGGGKVPD